MTQQNKTSQQQFVFFPPSCECSFHWIGRWLKIQILNTKCQPIFCCHFYLNWNDNKQNFGLHLVLSIWLLVIIRSNEKNRTYLWELWGKTLGFSFFHDMTTIVITSQRWKKKKKTYILQSLFMFFMLTTFLLNSTSFFQINSYKSTHLT